MTVLKDAITFNLNAMLRSSVSVLGGVAYLCYLNWKLALVLLGIVPATAIAASVYGRYVRNLAKETRTALADATETAAAA